MEWSEFLNDSELKSRMYSHSPDGKLLFNKVIHDVLECFTGYKECVRIATSLSDDVPISTLDWLLKWEHTIDKWNVGMVALGKQFKDLPSASLDWPNLIGRMGNILTKVPEIRKEADTLTLPSSAKLRLTIELAIRFISKLNLIWKDIEAKEYKRLWTIQQYGDLIE